MSDMDADFGFDDTEQGREELEALVQGALKATQEATDRAEAAEARCKRLEKLLEGVRQQCFFDEDDGQIGVSEDVVIPSDMFDEICAALSDTAQQETADDIAGRAAHYSLGRKDGRDEMRDLAAKLADPPLMHRKGKPGLWRQRRAQIAADIRNLPLDPETGGE